MERWRQPVVPLGVEDSGKSLLYAGRLWNIPTFILDHDGIERVRLGYVCIADLEPHETNHPHFCQVCGFPIRAIQDDVFEEMYEGEARIGPTTTDAEELEIAQEIVDRGSHT